MPDLEFYKLPTFVVICLWKFLHAMNNLLPKAYLKRTFIILPTLSFHIRETQMKCNKITENDGCQIWSRIAYHPIKNKNKTNKQTNI